MAFLGLIRAVKQEHGGDKLREILDCAPSATQLACSERIRRMGWYPYEGFSGFLEATDDTLGAGDLDYCFTLGRAAAKSDLETTFGDFLAKASTENLIRGCTMVWSTYYRSAGSMTAIAWQPDRTVLRISDFADMHPGHCRLMEGWMIESMELVGAKVRPDAAETKCMSRGDECHEFACSWAFVCGSGTRTRVP